MSGVRGDSGMASGRAKRLAPGTRSV
jgi:hypothetical protein